MKRFSLTWVIVLFYVTTAFPCDYASETYIEKYRLQSNYIPDELTTIKHIRLNFHSIQNPNPGEPAGNFEDTAGTYIYFEKLLGHMNYIIQRNFTPTHPVPEVCGDACHIRETGIRFQMKGVYFSRDEKWNKGIWSNVHMDTSLQNNPETEVNIFLVNGGSGAAGRASMPSINDLDKYQFIVSRDVFNSYNAEDPENSSTWVIAGHFLHEFGHIFGLKHTYNSESCDTSNIDYLADVFGPNFKRNCHHDGGFHCDIPDPENTCTNNAMGGTKEAGYYSPLQLGRIHRSMAVSSARRFSCSYDSTALYTVSADETWDFSIKFYRDVLVKSGVTLTVSCDVQLVPQAKIRLEPGAKLLINGGKIRTAPGCDSNDEKIKADLLSEPDSEKLNKQKNKPGDTGVIRLKNGGSIEDINIINVE